MTQSDAYEPDARILAAFLVAVFGDLDAVVELRERLFLPVPPEQEEWRRQLLEAMAPAWGEVRQTLPELIDALLSEEYAEGLRAAGLTGLQLAFKLAAWRESRVQLYAAFEDSDEADPGPPPEPPGVPPDLPGDDPPLPRKQPRWKKWALKKLEQTLAHADTILESLAGVVNMSEPVKEIKKTVEKVAGDTADALPDGPG